MGDYASKGVAGAGLGTGIAGLSLGVLNAMGRRGYDAKVDRLAKVCDHLGIVATW